MITIDSVWDTHPNAKAAEILKPYKEKVDAMMYEVIGTSAMKMEKGAPESLLSDLVAGVLQQALDAIVLVVSKRLAQRQVDAALARGRVLARRHGQNAMKAQPVHAAPDQHVAMPQRHAQCAF